MKLLLLSDLHIEFAPGSERAFIEAIDPAQADVLVLAGDICNVRQLPLVLGIFAESYAHVLYVTGNHEYYHSSWDEVTDVVKAITDKRRNVHWLNGNAVTIDNLRYVGGTLWFPHRDTDRDLRASMNDFQLIKGFTSRVYEENERVATFLRNNVQPSDVVVTHHLPSPRVISPRFKNSALNAFFVCDMDDVINDCQPVLWCFGHTHDSVDMMLGETRMLCNPFGYVGQDTNRRFRADVVVTP